MKVFNIHEGRLARQRRIKVNQCQHPVVSMTKKQVIDQKLFQYVLHPTEDSATDITSARWWKFLSDEDEVEVKFPHEKHGLQGKPGNHSKPLVRDAFLRFVDASSQPNGRHAGSFSPQFYFISKFTRIDPPKTGEKDFDTKAHASVVWTFNHAQAETGQPPCSAFAAQQWLKDHRPKVALHPHKSDYCDTCKGLKEEISRYSATLKRLRQSGSAPEQELRSVQLEVETSEQTLKSHKEEASAGRDYYNTTVLTCKENWAKIVQLSSTPDPTSETLAQLATAQHLFTLVLSADYQQSKLIPHWGHSEQPGSTYYLQKLSFDIFGIVDHRNDKNFITVFDEGIGPKNTDHTISLLSRYISSAVADHPWIKRVCVFLDNAGSTNKNRYLFSWGMEFVEGRHLDHLRFCFLLAGHTKFSPDRLFSLVANAYNREDVFTPEDLHRICSRFSTASIEDGTSILSWRSALVNKYSELAGVRKLHDFLIVRVEDKVVMKVRDSCHKGSVVASPLHVTNPAASASPTSSYSQARKDIPSEKIAHLTQMYSKFVPPDQWPDYVSAHLPHPSSRLTPMNPSTQVPVSCSSAQSVTSSLNLSTQAPVSGSSAPSMTSSTNPSTPVTGARSNCQASTSQPPPAKRRRVCSTRGCNGSGHRNIKRWSECHTTRAGCPRVPR